MCTASPCSLYRIHVQSKALLRLSLPFQQAEEDSLLHSLQDLVPDELMSAELAELDTFCLDSVLMDVDGSQVQNCEASSSRGEALRLSRCTFVLHCKCSIHAHSVASQDNTGSNAYMQSQCKVMPKQELACVHAQES